MSDLRELARKIGQIADQLEQHKQSLPSNNETSWMQSLPKELGAERILLLDTLQELKRQVQGPEAALEDMLFEYTDTQNLRLIYYFRLPQAIPLDGSVPCSKVSQQVGLDEGILRRIFHYAMSNNIFAESPSQLGHIMHTPISRLLATNSDAFNALGMISEELVPAAHHLLDALKKYPAATEPNETGWNIANNTDMAQYEFFARHKDAGHRGERFGGAMKFLVRGDHTSLKHLLDGFPWKEYDREDVTMVDVGGGHGGVTTEIALVTSNMHFIIQDFQQTVEAGKEILSPTLKNRVKFIAHDFFETQPARGCDIYFFRWIMHNWSDKYVLRILRALTPALKSGAKVLIYEEVLEDKVDTRWSRHGERYLDMIMLNAYNGCARTDSNWARLFREADESFVFEGVRRFAGSAMSLVEATWKGGTVKTHNDISSMP